MTFAARSSHPECPILHTLQLALTRFRPVYATDQGLTFAVMAIVSLPPVMLFLASNVRFIKTHPADSSDAEQSLSGTAMLAQTSERSASLMDGRPSGSRVTMIIVLPSVAVESTRHGG